ncbi:hypothetical protein ANN_07826 [Periplaneta americana]|uniref:Uncharacterized protein n=1 Tax=Periplaneta americana TaxID=6978 RepID=A0ABQ8T132_PERAM|nr:hypothetical protein ANN_07826 [Periplaneta americana]
MSPGSNTESYPAFTRIGLRENPGKNLNQVTCPDQESNPGHLVSRLDALTHEGDNASEMSPGSSVNSYQVFVLNGLRKTPEKTSTSLPVNMNIDWQLSSYRERIDVQYDLVLTVAGDVRVGQASPFSYAKGCLVIFNICVYPNFLTGRDILLATILSCLLLLLLLLLFWETLNQTTAMLRITRRLAAEQNVEMLGVM